MMSMFRTKASRQRRQAKELTAERDRVTVGDERLQDPDSILEIQNLHTRFSTDSGDVHAVDGIDIRVRRGSTTCIVGESGSGKSAAVRSVLQVVEHPGRIHAGSVLFRADPHGAVRDLAQMNPTGPAIRSVRGREIGMVFQEPMTALSPVHTIGNQIREVLELHTDLSPDEINERVISELERVGIPQPDVRVDAYTFELSGGMRQRAMLAMALIARPSLLIADEPTTALDVTTQAQILDLLSDLKESLDMTVVFITHDLGVVAEIADDVVVMNEGKIVETGTVDQIFHDPQQEYTRTLLSGLPQFVAASANGTMSTVREEVEANEQGVAQTDHGDAPAPDPLLQIRNLRVEFDAAGGGLFGRKNKDKVVAVNDVSLAITKGTTVGLVGESGCGKTTLGRTVLRALKPTSGTLVYGDDEAPEVDLAGLDEKELLPFRRRIRMIFQDPYGSLNPRMTVGQSIGEVLRVTGQAAGSELDDRVAAMLERVGLRSSMISRYPNAFSGGERQRIGIARALITEPKLVVADEAVSALDMSIRGQILELLADLQQDLGLTYLFISHDLSVIERICDRVAVMYYGEIVEEGPIKKVFHAPEHTYTRALLSAVPIPDPRLRGTRERVIYEPEIAAER
ncbi:ABC transporter ATP-binding protein [Sanguibacter sp. Z1732]|uniref:ABC transporter ATP-binding protein n=1 Tax=Sanguibacter sp. Z1732 TaxID=3435412 RepID=UPI003D9C90EC